MTSVRTTGLLALVLLLVSSACAQGDATTATTQPYEFPAELIAAGEALATEVTTTTVPRLSAEPSAVEPPPPRAAAEALEQRFHSRYSLV